MYGPMFWDADTNGCRPLQWKYSPNDNLGFCHKTLVDVTYMYGSKGTYSD